LRILKRNAVEGKRRCLQWCFCVVILIEASECLSLNFNECFHVQWTMNLCYERNWFDEWKNSSNGMWNGMLLNCVLMGLSRRKVLRWTRFVKLFVVIDTLWMCFEDLCVEIDLRWCGNETMHSRNLVWSWRQVERRLRTSIFTRFHSMTHSLYHFN
jgi:hypothetical protein